MKSFSTPHPLRRQKKESMKKFEKKKKKIHPIINSLPDVYLYEKPIAWINEQNGWFSKMEAESRKKPARYMLYSEREKEREIEAERISGGGIVHPYHSSNSQLVLQSVISFSCNTAPRALFPLSPVLLDASPYSLPLVIRSLSLCASAWMYTYR